MMDLGTHITAVVAAVVVAAGGLVGATSSDGSSSSRETAIVIDAAAARDGRDLVDPRLDPVDAEVRLPRTAAEARTDVRYLAELGHRIVVAGPQASAAADATDVAAVRAAGVDGALAAVSP